MCVASHPPTRFLTDLPDPSPALLPTETRNTVWRLLPANVATSITSVAAAIRTSAAHRSTQVQVSLTLQRHPAGLLLCHPATWCHRCMPFGVACLLDLMRMQQLLVVQGLYS
jgi:hypothetical protein